MASAILLRSPKQCAHYLASQAAVTVCVGNFDGFHRGHQELFAALDQVPNSARVMLTFAPHPRRIIKGIKRSQALSDPAFQLLTPLRERVCLAVKYGFSVLYQIPFNRRFAALSPEEFLETYLFKALKPKLVAVGEDWGYGKGRAGGIELLRRVAKKYGSEVYAASIISDSGGRISSSRVRHALEEGDIPTAAQLLARPFSFHGKVIGGRRRGKQLGFPTANLFAPMQFLPRAGVYATCVRFPDGKCYFSVTNIGFRPTFSEKSPSVETHLLDYAGPNFYGERLELEFVQRLREEKHFSSVDELITQIGNDIQAARGIFDR